MQYTISDLPVFLIRQQILIFMKVMLLNIFVLQDLHANILQLFAGYFFILGKILMQVFGLCNELAHCCFLGSFYSLVFMAVITNTVLKSLNFVRRKNRCKKNFPSTGSTWLESSLLRVQSDYRT